MVMEMFMLLLVLRSSLASTGTDCNSKTIEILGAGSPFPSSLYQELGAMYSANRSLDRSVNVNFDVRNSIYGIEKVEEQTAENPIVFAASQIPLTLEEKRRYPELLTFPTSAGALAIVFNIPKISNINVTAASMADIFMGKISYWNDSSIQSVNPSVTLPNKKILLVARSDIGAGDTLILTSALSAISDMWNKSYGTFVNPDFVGGDCCNSTKWPSHIDFYGNRVTGMIGIVASIPYTLGYVSWPNTLGTGVTVAKIINAYGTLVEPNSTESVRSAMDYFFNRSTRDSIYGLEYEINNAKSEHAYPFGSFSYMILNRTTHPNVTSCQMQELTGFLTWLFSPVISSQVSKYGLIPLSSKVTDFIIRSVLPQITYQGTSVYTEFQLSLIHPDTTFKFSTNMVIIGCVTLVIIAAVTMSISVSYYRKMKLNDTLWILNGIKILRQDDFLRTKLNPTMSVTFSNSSELTTKSDTKSFFTEGFWENFESTVFLSMVNLKRGSNWNNKTKTVFNKFRKEINHANVLQFLGVTVIDTKLYFVNQHVSIKGTLHYVLRTCPFQINESIKMNIASDILEGLKYLHQRNIFHGSLNSLECYVDVAWCVKIARWEVGTVHSVDENRSNCTDLLFKVDECETSLASQETLIKLLYLDPEYFSNYGKPTFSMDVFSFGLLLVEIFTRKLPYAQEVELELNSYPDIVRQKFNSKQFSAPMNLADIPERVLDLVRKTVIVSPRLSDINTLHKAIKEMTGNKKSVVDILMQSMEKYMTELEEKVIDRTVELFTVNDKVKDLLYDVLPKQIATKLINGQPVKPEFYECCTIFFSDIFGFSTISATSTPNQVLNFLNSLYTVFDQILEQSDVYKVDTIGDVYMAASGLPVRNGIDHCKHIATFALAVIDIGNLFQIPHLKNDKLKLRIGINSGPVTTGIIGNKMPQFCVFGDTVHIASKMQCTSLENRIQVSETTQKMLGDYFHEFNLELRGDVEISGKGTVKTYWLLSSSVPFLQKKKNF